MSKIKEIRAQVSSMSNRKKYNRRNKIENIKYDESMVTKISTKVQPETHVRFEDAQKFYLSSEWIELRNIFIARKNRETNFKLKCNICKKSINSAIGLDVDHVKPIRLFWYDRLKIDNLQITCKICNKKKGNNYD
jgi:hypothetical protein